MGLVRRIRTHPTCPSKHTQYGEAQRHLEAHQGEPSLLLSLAYVLAQTTPDQACAKHCVNIHFARTILRLN